MEPLSIYDLTTTVLGACWKLYNFFKDVHDAPEEIQDYVYELESLRTVLVQVEEYAKAHERSTFRKVDGMRLETLRVALKECEVTFTVQLSKLWTYQSGDSSSVFSKLRKNVEFVFGREAIEQSMARLQRSKDLLSLSVSTSVGCVGNSTRQIVYTELMVARTNSIIIREEMGHFRSELREVLENDEKQLQLCKEMMGHFGKEIQQAISFLMGCAEKTGFQSAARLEFVASAVAEDTTLPAAGDEASENSGHPAKMQQSQGSINQSTGGMSLVEPGGSVQSASNSGKQAHPRFSNLWEDVMQNLVPNALERGALFPSVSFEDVLKLAETNKPQQTRIEKMISAFASYVPDSYMPNLYGTLLTIMRANQTFAEDITAGLADMSNALRVLKREMDFYRDPTIEGFAAEAYQIMLETTMMCMKEINSQSGSLSIKAIINPPIRLHNKFKDALAKMQRISEKITREVDYCHRVEMRQASYKIAEMHVEQRKITAMLQDQRWILESLQQERKIIDLIRDQQRILQAVQTIQEKMHMQTIDHSSVGKTTLETH